MRVSTYLVNPLRDVQRWRPDLLVDGLRRDVLGRVAATLEVLDHVLRRRVERVGKTRLDGVEALAGVDFTIPVKIEAPSLSLIM